MTTLPTWEIGSGSPRWFLTEKHSLQTRKNMEAFTANKYVAFLHHPAPTPHQWSMGFQPQKLTTSKHALTSCHVPPPQSPYTQKLPAHGEVSYRSPNFWHPTAPWLSVNAVIPNVSVMKSCFGKKALHEMTWNDFEFQKLPLQKNWKTLCNVPDGIVKDTFISACFGYTPSNHWYSLTEFSDSPISNASLSCWVLSSYWLRMVMTKQVFWCLFVYFQRSAQFTSARHKEGFWPTASVGSLGKRPWDTQQSWQPLRKWGKPSSKAKWVEVFGRWHWRYS